MKLHLIMGLHFQHFNIFYLELNNIILSLYGYNPAAQSLQTGNGNGPPELREYEGAANNNRIFLHHQAIVHTYKFNSCGNITAWGADVFQNDQNIYTVDFQVWRPSPTNNFTGAGCYSLVGNNRFTSISLNVGIVIATPSHQDYIQYQSGDVLGFYVENASPVSGRPDNGVVIQNTGDFTKDTIWYASIAPAMATSKDLDCPYTVGKLGDLKSYTHAAPVISIATSKLYTFLSIIICFLRHAAAYPCPTSPPASPSVLSIPSLSTASSPLIASTLITVTQIPTNSKIDRTLPVDLPIWLIVTIVVVAVLAMTCTCVLVTAILMLKKRGSTTHARKGNLRNIIIQNEIYDQASIKSHQSVKLKVSSL